MNINDIHRSVTNNIEDAKPPKIDVKELDDRTLEVKYSSARNLEFLIPGLVKGLGNYYNDKIDVDFLYLYNANQFILVLSWVR